VADAAGEGHRQTSAGRTVAKQGLNQSRSGLDPWVPGDQDCVGEVQDIAEVQGSAGKHDHDQRLADGGHRTQDLDLTSGQADAGHGVGLPRPRRVFADEGDGDVGLADQVQGLVAEAPVVDDRALPQRRPDRAGRAGDVLAAAVEAPGTQEGLSLLHERTSQQDTARIGGQREGALVGEQHEGRGGGLASQGSGGRPGRRRRRGGSQVGPFEEPMPHLE
jgi:hypothetical protein